MKPRLSDDIISMRIAAELKDGEVVNIGYGFISNVSSFIIPPRDIIFHAENGIIGYGRVLTAEDEAMMDYNQVNAASQFVATLPGMSFVDVATAFDCVRTGRVDTTILGAYQVSEKGDLANWSTDPKGAWGSIGGAMDMPVGARRVIVGMKHTENDNMPRILKKCTLPLTAPRCVNLIVTDIAVIAVTKDGLELKEVAPEWTVEEVQALTEPRLIVREVKEFQL